MPRQIAAKPLKTSQDYLDRLFKIVPVEITAAYLAVQSFLTDTENPTRHVWLLIAFAGVATLLVPFYLTRLQHVTSRVQLVLSTISFPIWAANISTSVLVLAFPFVTKEALTLIMIAWVLATPVLVDAEKKQ